MVAFDAIYFPAQDCFFNRIVRPMKIVHLLLQVSSERKSNSGKENVVQDEKSGKGSSKNKRKDTSLLRPVRFS